MAAMNNNSSIHVKVLVVDDDWTSLSIVSSMLKKWSYEVVTVKSPVDAMATLRIQQNYFNLVVTDLHMPIMSGSELARQINLEFKSIPVILMSADDKESVIVECLASGAVYYIIKPINPEDLKNVWQYAAAAKKGKVQEIAEDVTLHDLEDIGDGYGSRRRVSMISSSDDENTNTNGNANDNVSVSLDSSNKRKMCSKDEEEEEGMMSNNGGKAKKYKVVWTTVLHNLFLQAVRHIGLEKAVPKKILEFMAVPGLTRENVASHLQKYRLFLKRVAMRSSVPTRNILSEKTLRSSFAVGHPMLMMARNAQLNNMINNNNNGQQQQTLRLSTLGPPLFPAPRSLTNAPHYSLPHNNLQPPAFQANLGHPFGARLANTGANANLLQLSHHRNYGGSNIAAFGNFGYGNQLIMGPNGANGLTGQTFSGAAAVVNGNQFNTRIVPVEHSGGQRVLENANRVSNGEMGRSYSLDELIGGTVSSTNPTLNSNRVGDNIDVDALFLDHNTIPPQQQDGGGKEAMNSNGSAQCYNNPQVHPQANESVIFDELHDLIPMESGNASWHTQSLTVQNQNQNQNHNQECAETVNSNFGSTTPYSYPYQIGESSNIAQNFATCSQTGRGGSADADLFAMIQNINSSSDASRRYFNDQSWGDDGLVQ